MLNDSYFFYFEKKEWKKTEIQGEPPSQRAGHSCTLIENNIVLLFGGGFHFFLIQVMEQFI